MEYKSKFKAEEIDASLEKMVQITWEELVALRDKENLIAGQMYRITDYETFSSMKGTQCAGHPFDLVLTALSNNVLDEKCSAIWSARDANGYFADCNLPAWDVRYCLDNDKGRYNWAVAPVKTIKVDLSEFGVEPVIGSLNGTFEYENATYAKWECSFMGQSAYILTPTDAPAVGHIPVIYSVSEGVGIKAGTVASVSESSLVGKGVIYYLTDDMGNSACFDFKNIMFSRPLSAEGVYDAENGTPTFCYTFNCIEGGNVLDKSVVDKNLCFRNVSGLQSMDNVHLSFIGSLCQNNSMGDACQGNTFGNSFIYNTCGNGFVLNVFGDGCDHNIFGNNCLRNTFRDNCAYNVFGDDCINNVFGNSATYNTFAQGCHENSFSDSCLRNSFGIGASQNSAKRYFRWNIIGNQSGGNKFGANCSYNEIGNFSQGNNFTASADSELPMDGCSNIKIDNGCINVKLWCSSGKIQNVRVTPSVSESVIEIPVGGALYLQTVAKNSSGTVKVYCEADLVQ